MLFDNVVPCDESAAFLKTLQQLWANDINIAFLPAAESKPEDYRLNIDAGPQANMDPVTSGGLTINYADANTWILKTHLSSSQFLVINDNYNKDWHAFINGRQAHLFRANVAFKGLWIPAGESSVLLRFSTPKRYALHFGLIFLFMGTFLYSLILLRKGRQSASHG